LRSNPAIEPGTHDGLAVGRESSKFGMDSSELLEAATVVTSSSGALQLIGVHLHAGSQLHDMVAWQTAVTRALSAYGALVAANLIDAPTHAEEGVLCVGGGFPLTLDETDDPSVQARAFRTASDAAWSAATSPVPPHRAIEPGRALVASATLLIARVLHVRARNETVGGSLAYGGGSESQCERQVILDAGMSELIRPALYGARHPVTALETSQINVLSAVHGPICESTDALGAHLLPTELARGDLLAIHGAGAYADAMWSPYNSRPRPARLTVSESGAIELLRRRGEG
jgi:diaminopimelate decarboxylase